MKKTTGIVIAIVTGLAGLGLGGCNERTLFKENDPLTRRRVEYYSSYSGETTRVARDRQKHNNEWGFGPNLFGGRDN